MPTLATKLNVRSEDFKANAAAMRALVDDLNAKLATIALGGGDFVASGTFTAEVRPVEGISFRLEYRHDASDDAVPLYYKRGLQADGQQNVSASQNTLTFGMTGWF